MNTAKLLFVLKVLRCESIIFYIRNSIDGPPQTVHHFQLAKLGYEVANWRMRRVYVVANIFDCCFSPTCHCVI